MTRKAQSRLIEGMEALKLALDPELATAKAEWDEAEAKRVYVGGSYSPSIRGKMSGWGKGGPPASTRIERRMYEKPA